MDSSGSGRRLGAPPFDLSEAIVLSLKRYPGRNADEFAARFGDGNAHSAVRSVLDETMRVPIDMAGKSLVELGDEVAEIMRQRHPELSDAALRKLGNFFTYLVK